MLATHLADLGVEVDLLADAIPHPPTRIKVVRTSDPVRYVWTQAGPDTVFHIPYLDLGVRHYAGALGRVPTVLTVPDLILASMPEYFPSAETHRAFVRQLHGAFDIVRRVIVYSDFVARGLANRFGVAAARTDVIPLAVDFADDGGAQLPNELANTPYLLCVGKDYRHKNHVVLVDALARLVERGRRELLVFAGETVSTGNRGEVLARANTLGIRDRIRELGHVDDPILHALIANASALLYPSRVEGFGLPVLEGMALGAPLVCADAAWLDPMWRYACATAGRDDAAGFAERIAEILENPECRRRLVDAGRDLVARFSWARTARLTLASYERALGETRSALRQSTHSAPAFPPRDPEPPSVTAMVGELFADAPSPSSFDAATPFGEPLQHSAELRYLNHRWALDAAADTGAQTHSWTIKGLTKQGIRRVFLSALARYRLDEREWLANLVRVQNALAERSDEFGVQYHTIAAALRRLAPLLVERLQHIASRDLCRAELLERRIAALETEWATRNSELTVPPEWFREHIAAKDFAQLGSTFFGYFTDLCGLQPGESVLDVYCGPGRVAIPLTRYLSTAGRYLGLDVHRPSIDWCRDNITPQFPNFEFRFADVQSPLFNPEGLFGSFEYSFPASDKSFDFVFLGAAFTHILPAGLERYVVEIARVLRKRGRCLATFFLLNEESRYSIERGTSSFDFRHRMNGFWTIDPAQPETAIAYDEAFVHRLFREHGLTTSVRYGKWCGRGDGFSGQDVIVATK